jgi:hypothetical protein
MFAALRNKDNLPGFEFYSEEDANEFAEKYNEAVRRVYAS